MQGLEKCRGAPVCSISCGGLACWCVLPRCGGGLKRSQVALLFAPLGHAAWCGVLFCVPGRAQAARRHDRGLRPPLLRGQVEVVRGGGACRAAALDPLGCHRSVGVVRAGRLPVSRTRRRLFYHQEGALYRGAFVQRGEEGACYLCHCSVGSSRPFIFLASFFLVRRLPRASLALWFLTQPAVLDSPFGS